MEDFYFIVLYKLLGLFCVQALGALETGRLFWQQSAVYEDLLSSEPWVISSVWVHIWGVNSAADDDADATAKSLQSCPTLWDPIDGNPPGSPDPGILQARTLEWVVISFSNAWKWRVKVKSLSHVQIFVTSWSAAYQAPPSMAFSRQEFWRGCHCLLQGLTLVGFNSIILLFIFKLSHVLSFHFSFYPWRLYD